jgi:hypothetical protein
LPDLKTRQELIQLYMSKELLHKKNGKHFINSVQNILNQKTRVGIATQTEGLSSAEIADIIKSIRKAALASKNGIVTKDIIKTAVQAMIEKKAINTRLKQHYKELEDRKILLKGHAIAPV